ncbi:MAG: hypothetical protein K1X94_20050 [Sandaracinaceae bacterium]|nr:hypothetical protein [Sandaracinaceae bacterium]
MRPLVAIALSVMACGCPSSPSGTDAGADGGTDAFIERTPDAAEGTDGGPMACNSVTNVGTAITQTNVATAPVSGAGGVIAPGMYVLTEAVIYTGPTGMTGPTGLTFTDTVVLAADGSYDRAFSVVGPGADGTPMYQSGTFTTDGASLTVTQTCPAGRQPFTSYDSDGTTLRIYSPGDPSFPATMFEYTML